ncbi:MAG TPA: 3-methyl-2-oxobutanoate hydroxymethyltransferase [Oligoflexia bacterium]|nr:3-methyl-2-oxobutanoate hydroxymethyltransferase [Oligoflexia bacterium]
MTYLANSAPTNGIRKRVTAPWVRAQKNLCKLSMLTAYDFAFATLLDRAGIDMLLVGDSLGPVIYGTPNTLSVTLDDILRHTRTVSSAATRALVIADLPFLSYQVSLEQAVTNAGRCLKEAGAHAVKLEGGVEQTETIRAIVRAGIPVVAHIGLTPQSVHAVGGYRTYGKTEAERDLLLADAKAVAEAGAFCVVLECVQEATATEITKAIAVPTIGIGSGSNCDGQVLVTQDLVGLTVGHVPKFVNPVADVAGIISAAAQSFVARMNDGEESKPVVKGENVISH